MTDDPVISEYLHQFRHELRRFLESHAGSILRFETVDDLMQGVHLEVVRQSGVLRSHEREVFLAWMYRIAHGHIRARRDHWSALKRRPGALFRLTQSGGATGAVAEPADTATGPATFADRREKLTIAIRALNALPARDARMVRWSSEGLTAREQAERLAISVQAAERARQRALDRFRKTYHLLIQRC